MAHTLAAVFDNRADADRARAELMTSGFDNASVQLSDSASGTGAGDKSIGSSIKHFFSHLFGDDDNKVYTEALNSGKVVLTVQADSEEQIERAADIVERYGPIDIDEQRSQWRAAGRTGAQAQSSVQQQNRQSAAGAQSSAQTGSQQGGSQSPSSMQYANQGEHSIPVLEEALQAVKRAVQRGGIRIFQRGTETPAQDNTALRKEQAKAERQPANQPADPGSIDTDGTVELRVDVEQMGTVDGDTYFYSHWSRTYASLGGAYEDYEPAYRYGSDMRASSSYRNSSWDDAENTLRRDWESRYPQSAWEKFKAAIRHGWDRITS
jgi:stress response protein YsnF